MRKYEALRTDAPPPAWFELGDLYATPKARADYVAGEDGWQSTGCALRVDAPVFDTPGPV